MEILKNAAISVFIFLNAVVSGALGFLNLPQFQAAPPVQPAATTTQIVETSAHFTATTTSNDNVYYVSLVGIPAFYAEFPIQFGQPTLTHDSGLPELTFCKTNNCRDYYLRISFATTSILDGQTLDTVAAEDINATDQARIVYRFSSNGRLTLAQAVSTTSPVILYYMEVNENTVLEIVVGRPTLPGDKADIEHFKAVEDAIVRSITFEK